VHDFLFSADFNDPTSGFFYMVPLLMQPQLFADTRILIQRSLEKIGKTPLFNTIPMIDTDQKNENDPDLTASDEVLGPVFNNDIAFIS